MGVAQQVTEGFFDLVPHRVAVVMVDFQNDFCSPEVFGGGPVTNTRNAKAAQRANAFAAHAAGLGAHVVYTRQILDMGHLTARQRRWERPDGLCAAGTWGAGLFVEPVRGSSVVVKYRYDCWQSPSFVEFLDGKDIDGLVICGVELVCCVLYAVLGAAERGYHYMVPQDLVSGQDPGNETGDKAVRDYLHFSHPEHAIGSSEEILSRWRARAGVFPRGGLSADTGAVSERLRVREIDDDEGQRLVRIIRRGSGSVVTWRRAQMVLLSAQGMDAAGIAKVAFTGEDRVLDVIRNFNADGFGSLYPKYRGGRPPEFTLGQRREIKKIAKAKPAELGLPFSTWSLARLAEFLVAEGVVDDISHEGLRILLRLGSGTCSPPASWARTNSTGTSSCARPGPSSLPCVTSRSTGPTTPAIKSRPA